MPMLLTITRGIGLLDDAELSTVAPHIPEPPLGVHDHLPDPGPRGGNLEDAKLAGAGIQPYDRIGGELVAPDEAGAVHRDGVRRRARAGRQRVFLHRERLRIEAEQAPPAVERDPDRPVGRSGHPARRRAVRHLHLADRSALRIELAEAAAAELAEPDVPLKVERDPVRVATRSVLGDLP